MQVILGEKFAFTAKPEWIFSPDTVAEVLRSFSFRPDVAAELQAEANLLASDTEKRTAFLTDFADWFEQGAESGDHPGWPLWRALLVVAALPHLQYLHQQIGITTLVTSATACDLQRWVDNSLHASGLWHFDKDLWLRNHVQGKLFEVGRLQFAFGEWKYPFTVYQTAPGEPAVALANAGLNCSPEGWLQRGVPGFQTTLQTTSATIRGNAADPETGRIQSEKTILPAHSKILMKMKTPVLDVHIPEGDTLRITDCVDSFKAACEFFKRLFPNRPFAAFCCDSWLLDRGLRRVLPAHSNILKFGALFSPLAFPDANDDQLRERVLEISVRRETSLQRAIRTELARGAVFRMTSGFIYRDVSVEMFP